MNPYLVLGVPIEADDQQIRQAYLAAIKVATPDTDPQRFKEISAAYEKIKDEISRARLLLLNRQAPGDTPWDTVVRYARMTLKPTPMSYDTLKEFLRSCTKT